ncbi:MAG: polyhydroxybutyrate depolymerase [Calditrichaeota bacterium]|nr:polyhydroxybutyrate depolymerase [Calditrichota bacterium]
MQHKNKFWRLAVFLLSVTLASATTAGERRCMSPGDHELVLVHGDRTRYYLLHLPSQYDHTKLVPLVLVLHGGGSNAHNAARMTRMSEKADREGFLVAYPYGSGFFRKRVLTWNAANCCGRAKQNDVDDVGFIRTLIDTLLTNYEIDPARVYVTGMSNGGMMAFRLGCELADKIAAIAPVAAAFNDDPCEPSAPVSVIMFNGTLDDRVRYNGGVGKGREKRIDRSVSDAVVFWVEHNHCTLKSDLEKQGKIVREVFFGGREGAAVVLYTIRGGRHAWPGGRKGYLFGDEPTRRLSATDAMWEFFVKHPKFHTGK